MTGSLPVEFSELSSLIHLCDLYPCYSMPETPFVLLTKQTLIVPTISVSVGEEPL